MYQKKDCDIVTLKNQRLSKSRHFDKRYYF